MDSALDQREMLLAAWRTNNRVTTFLVENLPHELWAAKVPGAPRRTVRMIAGHIHNARCMWIKTLGSEHGIVVPQAVNRHKVGAKELLPALRQSSRGIVSLLALGFDRGGAIPASSSYTWRNLPLDVGHVLTYFVAHEGHHRGQIVMLARQLGFRLPVEITGGLWHFSKRASETGNLSRAKMQASDPKRWFPAVLLLAAVYFVIAVLFGEFASKAASNSLRETWNGSAFLVSGIAFAVHIGFEHFRLRNSVRHTASHTATAVAAAAFALALKANIHELMAASAYRPRMLVALLAWPLLTGVPAFIVALAAAAALARLQTKHG